MASVTTKIKPRKNGVNPKSLNVKELLFCQALAADVDFNAVAAVREIYPKNSNPSAQANRLLSRPRVQKMLGKVLGDRLRRLELKADDVLEYLRFALFYNPLEHFTPTEDGWWSTPNPKELPDEVGRLIERIREKTVTHKNGSVSRSLEIELLTHTTALGLAMKHVGVEKVDVTHNVNIDWDALSQGQVIDVVGQRLLEEEK